MAICVVGCTSCTGKLTWPGDAGARQDLSRLPQTSDNKNLPGRKKLKRRAMLGYCSHCSACIVVPSQWLQLGFALEDAETKNLIQVSDVISQTLNKQKEAKHC